MYNFKEMLESLKPEEPSDGSGIKKILENMTEEELSELEGKIDLKKTLSQIETLAKKGMKAGLIQQLEYLSIIAKTSTEVRDSVKKRLKI